jgi:hypothetical protein
MEEAERAADILDDCGADDVDELANQFGYTNTRNMDTGENSMGNSSGNSARMRSRIFDRKLNDDSRLRD